LKIAPFSSDRILKACEEKPHKRYQSALEMHAHLLLLQSGLRR